MPSRFQNLTIISLILFFASQNPALASPPTGAEVQPGGQPSTVSSTTSSIFPAGFDVPAFSTTGWNEPGYVSLDATVPGALNIINADQPTNVFAATFIGNDFERHYALASSGGDLDQDSFGWIDTASGEFTELGTIAGGSGENWTSLAWDYSTQTLFATTGTSLYSIDPDALEATLLGDFAGTGVPADPVVIAMAISDQGQMFGVEINDNILIEIDPSNGQAQAIGDLGVNPTFAQDMDFDHSDGTLYWAGYFGGGDSQMMTINTATGAATPLGDIEDGAELNSFTLAVPAPSSSASVEPGSISVALEVDEATTRTLDIANLDDENSLQWAFTDDGAVQMDQADGAAIRSDIAVPAFSTTGWNEPGYVTLDATVPGALNIINADQPTNVFAATFIGNDFARHYALASGGGDLDQDSFGWIDTASGEFTELGTIAGGPGDTWTSMAWDYSTETLFAITGQSLYSIDPDTLEATLLGDFAGTGVPADPVVIAMAISNEGQMFGVEINDNVLIEIDPSNGQAEAVGDLGVNPTFAQDMDFDHRDGTLYWAGYFGGGDSQMHTINTATGAATAIGEIDDGAELLSFTLAVPAPLPCVLPNDIGWLDADILSGNVSPQSSQTVTLDINATGLSSGSYQAMLCLETNDLLQALIGIPVKLEVVDDPQIFQDRFEE